MASILRYLDSSNVIQSQSFDVLTFRGGDKPWKWRYVPNNIFDMADGSRRTEYRGFQRIFSVELRALNSSEDFLRAFIQAKTKSITYQGYTLPSEESFVTFESQEYEDEWFDGFKLTKRFVIELTESFIRTFWPIPNPIDEVDLAYFKNNVEITGTQASPQTLTTNTAPIALQETGEVFPAISLLSYKVTPVIFPANGTSATFNIVGNVTQSGADISFQVAMSDSGNPSSDGKFYGNVTLLLKAIP